MLLIPHYAYTKRWQTFEGKNQLLTIIFKFQNMNCRIITLLFFLTTFKGIACECSETEIQKLDSIDYKYSDLIVIGKVTKRYESGYNIKIQEVLKGKSEFETIKGIYTDDLDYDVTSCAFYPRSDKAYILYLKEIKSDNKKFYYSSACSANRTLDCSVIPIGVMNSESKTELINWTEFWIKKLRGK